MNDHNLQNWGTFDPPRRKGKRRTLLWALGWLLIFPLPLTILMLRNRKLSNNLRYGIIAAAWIIYLLVGVGMRGIIASPTRQTIPEPPTVTEAITTPRPTVKPTATPKPIATAPPATPAPTAAPAPEVTAAPLGVTPEFKATMDSYEAFFDEYIAFLKAMSDDPNNTAMLLKYATMMVQYTETMERLDAIDESKLSPADDAYYIEVMARIEVKLLEASQYIQ